MPATKPWTRPAASGRSQPQPPGQPANPYAPPRSNLVDRGADHGPWRLGRVVVLERDAALPARCIKCNRPASGPPLARRLSWHPPVTLLVVLPAIVLLLPLGLLLALVLRRSARVGLPLCPRHRRLLQVLAAIPLVLFAAAVVTAGLGLASSPPGGGVVVGLLLLAVTALFSAIHYRQLWAVRIDRDEVRIRGAGRDFLASLPRYP